MPLHDMPHTFSFIQVWHILNPQRQVQQKGADCLQQWQVLSRVLLLFLPRDFLPAVEVICCYVPVVLHFYGKYNTIFY